MSWLISTPTERAIMETFNPTRSRSRRNGKDARVKTMDMTLPVLTLWSTPSRRPPFRSAIDEDGNDPRDCLLQNFMLLYDVGAMTPCPGFSYEDVWQHKVQFPWEDESQTSPDGPRWPGDHGPYITRSGYDEANIGCGISDVTDSIAHKHWLFSTNYIPVDPRWRQLNSTPTLIEANFPNINPSPPRKIPKNPARPTEAALHIN